MKISTITGSHERSDNWTSLYTFALGILGGSFLAIGIGEVDLQQGTRGDLLRVYLAVATAMLGGGIGLFVSRLGDRIADQRAMRRKARAAELRMTSLISELELLRMNFASSLNNARDTDAILDLAKRIVEAASATPDFDEIVETARDREHAESALRWFRDCADRYKEETDREHFIPIAQQRQFTAGRFVSQRNIERNATATEALARAADHFDAKVSV